MLAEPKIVITGAGGFIGCQLVPRLSASGAKLLLVSRDPECLGKALPGYQICSYEELADNAGGAYMFLHLAAANNDKALSAEAFRLANIDLLLRVARIARAEGVEHFINFSSVHALDPTDQSDYAISKRAGADALAKLGWAASRTIYLPPIYGDRFSGKLSFLKSLPIFLANPVLNILAALKPILHINKLADRVIALPNDRQEGGIISDKPVALYHLIKRLVDLIFALAVILFAGWILVIVWGLVRLTSPGPGIFAQERVGKDGATFMCLKFRTMREGTKQAGTHELSASDVTAIGKFLRASKLDELPQVINILRNELSLIGPRPCLPTQMELIGERDKRGVLSVKPGITGLAQINDVDMSVPEALARWDERYMRLRGLFLDLAILWATMKGGGQGDLVKDERSDP